MNINNKRRRQRIAALTLASTLFLNGCGGNSKFDYNENEDNQLVAVDDTYIDSSAIKNYYVVSMYNTILKKYELYIARVNRMTGAYTDVFTNAEIYDGTKGLLEFVKKTELEEYIVALNMVQLKYSYDDMKNIYETIKEYYVFDEDNSLRKIRSKNNI